MANGPPTPPATTPAELRDEARMNPAESIAEPSVSVPFQPESQTRPEMYQSQVSAIGEAIAAKNYVRLCRVAGEADFNTANDREPYRLLIVAPLVLGYLINDEVSPARYALLRLPDSLSSITLSRALIALVVSTANREHSKVYDHAHALLNLASQPEFLDKDLGSLIHTLIPVFLDRFRSRTFELLSKAYISLPLPLACIYLGLPAEEILSVVEKYGWRFDPSLQVLYPAGPKSSCTGESNSSNFSSLNTFHFVADSVAKLEI